MAIKTTLGWVLSGPHKGKTLNSIENVNVNLLLESVNDQQRQIWINQ